MIAALETKKIKTEQQDAAVSEEPCFNVDSGLSSPHSDNSPDDVNDGNYLDVEGDSPISTSKLCFQRNTPRGSHIVVFYFYRIYGLQFVWNYGQTQDTW